MKLKRYVNNVLDSATNVIGEVVLFTLPLFAISNLGDHNGLLDSPRTKQAAKYAISGTKTVKAVEERWKDNVIYGPAMDGYNPLVIRDVTFEDGSTARLRYRTLAWQPFRGWLCGEEFDPKSNERYEVDAKNQLLRKVE